MPYSSRKVHIMSTFSKHISLVVASITVSFINSKQCRHCRNLSVAYLLYNRTSSFIKITNKRREIGDPCRTPRAVVITEVQRILFVHLYIATTAANMTIPQPNFFNIVTNFTLSSQSYALENSTKTTNNFFLLQNAQSRSTSGRSIVLDELA